MPFPIILSAPSGAGKTTITRRLLELRSDVGYSVSATTRAPRTGETDGVAYHFMSPESFSESVSAGHFAEHAQVHGNMYGTLRREVERVLDSGRHVVMDIDVQGAEQFVAAFPNAVRIFVLPPSGEVLVSRLRDRGTEDAATIARRLRDAVVELAVMDEFEYVVVNDDLERAVAQVSCIIDAESLRRVHAPATARAAAEIVSVLNAEVGNIEVRHILEK
ncbi:MAG: guanylate kinase [Gemmatimonadaceae bacterium]